MNRSDSFNDEAAVTSNAMPAKGGLICRRMFDDILPRLNRENLQATKCEVLSALLRFVDRLGLAANSVTWSEEVDWDQTFNVELTGKWQKFSNDFAAIDDIPIPRWNDSPAARSRVVERLFFIDASDKTYAAVATSRFVELENVKVTLVITEAKVAWIYSKKFHKRWENECLLLSTRASCQKSQFDRIKAGSTFLPAEGSTDRKKWELGRIEYIHPSSDGIARIVDVSLADGDLKRNRAVGNLAVLEVCESTAV